MSICTKKKDNSLLILWLLMDCEIFTFMISVKIFTTFSCRQENRQFHFTVIKEH